MNFSFALVIVFIINFNALSANDPAQNENSKIDQESDSNDDCPADHIIAEMVDIFTPEDYEEGKENIKSEIPSLKEIIKSMKRLEEYSRNVSLKMSEFTERMKSRFTETLMTIDLPQDCINSLARIMAAAKNGELWALKFFEAQPRPTNGLVELTGLPVGDYDQCLSIESPVEVDRPRIIGTYCGINLEPYVIMDPQQYPEHVFPKFGEDKQDSFGNRLVSNLFSNSMRQQKLRTYEDWLSVIGFLDANVYAPSKSINGLCLPSTCSPKDVSKAINALTYPVTRIPFTMSDDCEYVGKPVALNKYHIISIIGIASVFSVFVISSVIDCMPKTSMISKMFSKTSLEFYIKCFSVKRNAKIVFSVEQYSKFKSLDGFKAILTFFVVLLHTYEFGLVFFFNKNHYLSASYKMVQDFRNMFLPNILLMDNFFLVTAFLLGNTILSKLEKSKGKFNYIHYLLIRYLRILPILVLGLFCMFVFELIGDGPMWSNVKLYFTGPCYERWYKPLLLFNNALYYPNENSTVYSSIQCMSVTWYSSCDFQLYALAPIAFLFLYKSPKYGVLYNLVLLLVVVFVPLFNRLVLDFPHVYELLSHPNYQKVMNGWVVHYWGPVNYFQTYIIGILLAYAVRRKPNVYLGGRYVEICIWVITTFMSFSILYWQRNFLLPGYPYAALNGMELYFYLIFHKITYLTGFSWLIFACATGRGGFVNEMMGWKGFKIIDNLTLEIYIMHVFVFVYRIGVRRDQITYTDYYVWTATIFDFVASYVISVIVALVVTRPFARMTAALLRPAQPPLKRMTGEGLDGNNQKTDSLDNKFPEIDAIDVKNLNVIKYSDKKVTYRL